MSLVVLGLMWQAILGAESPEQLTPAAQAKQDVAPLMDLISTAPLGEAMEHCEQAIQRIDLVGYQNTAVLDQLDPLRETVLRRTLIVAERQADARVVEALANRLRSEHPNGRGWMDAALMLAKLTGTDVASAEAAIDHERKAQAAYDAAKAIRKASGGKPLAAADVATIRKTVASYLESNCTSGLRCRCLLGSVLLDSGALEEGEGLLCKVAEELSASPGSVLNRTIRTSMLESALPAVESVEDPARALALCQAVLRAQRAGAEQNLGLRMREESVRVRLLAKSVALACRLGDVATVNVSLDELDAWFPTADLTLEAKRLACKLIGEDAAPWMNQIASEESARAALDAWMSEFRELLAVTTDQPGRRQEVVVMIQSKWPQFMRTISSHETSGRAIDCLVEIGSRLRGDKDLGPQALESLTRARLLLGTRTGWVAFECWDAFSEVAVHRRNPAGRELCEATLRYDPIVLRRADAYLKMALLASEKDPQRAAENAVAGLDVLDSAGLSVARMIGYDSTKLLKGHLAIVQATSLRSVGSSAEAARAIEYAIRELEQVADDFGRTRDKFLGRARSLRDAVAPVARP